MTGRGRLVQNMVGGWPKIGGRWGVGLIIGSRWNVEVGGAEDNNIIT